MNAGSILNADMATVGRWLRTVLDWWLDELRDLVPARIGRGARGREKGGVAYDDHKGFGSVPAGSRIAIDLPAAMCLVREIELPLLRAADLRRLVALDLDRLFPLPAEAILTDVAVRHRDAGAGRMRVAVAALPRESARRLAEDAAGLAIGAIRAGPEREFDFLPAFQAEGLVARPLPAARFWWAVVAAMFLANVALLIGRDITGTANLEALVDTQDRAAAAARRIAQRVASEDRVRAAWIGRHEARDPIALLATTTRAVPAGAWVQRLSWNGDALRLAGYKQGAVDVIAALRKVPAFANVRATSSDAPAEMASGQPFDVSLDLRRRR